MRIVMATVARAKPYALETIRGMFDFDETVSYVRPVTMFVGSPERACFASLEDDPRVRIVGTSDEEWARIKDWPNVRKAAWNLCRAISSEYAVDDDGVLLCEDDLFFSRGWFTRLCSAKGALVAKHGTRVALSAYRTYDHWHKLNRGSLYGMLPGPFYASLCVYLTDDARRQAAERIAKVAVDEGQMPFDLCLGSTPGVGFFATEDSLVDHAGEESTIDGPSAVRRVAFGFKP